MAMDPDKALKQLREAVHSLKMQQDEFEATPVNVNMPMSADYLRKHRIHYDAVQEAIDNFEALDTWIRRGGYLPVDWQQGK
jgi:hypothetical protein